MLSYRHSYHAGNYADVLKHIMLIEILLHLGKKDKQFDYIDTHAGAGLYDLNAERSGKLQEYKNGIGKLTETDWPALAHYFEVVNKLNTDGVLGLYPGSPLIARHFMRPQDQAWFYEMHSEDAQILANNLQRDKRARVMLQDGLKGLLTLLPPISRRGLVLIDPSYEIKSDYDLVAKTVLAAYKKFATGTYAIWYPVVERNRILRLEKQLINSDIGTIHRFELAITADNDDRGMTASGMIVINPPWQLMTTMQAVLPKLTELLALDKAAFYKADMLKSA